MSLALEKNFTVAEDTAAYITLLTGKDPTTPFNEWKDRLPVVKPTLQKEIKSSSEENEKSEIFNEIEQFFVANHTPMQCMEFIINLQTKIKR